MVVPAEFTKSNATVPPFVVDQENDTLLPSGNVSDCRAGVINVDERLPEKGWGIGTRASAIRMTATTATTITITRTPRRGLGDRDPEDELRPVDGTGA